MSVMVAFARAASLTAVSLLLVVNGVITVVIYIQLSWTMMQITIAMMIAVSLLIRTLPEQMAEFNGFSGPETIIFCCCSFLTPGAYLIFNVTPVNQPFHF
jgi:hypothetical protein